MAGDEFDGFALVDWERSACLCDVGASGHSVAVAVDDDGRDVLWIVDEAELHAEHPRHGNSNQPHEQLGPLPKSVADRIRRRGPDVAHMCAGYNKQGQPCRLRVARPGDRCLFHRDKASAP
jgi:hypothetical protein